MNQHKKLRRSSTNYYLAGVIGGIAEYLDIDATALRVAWVLLVVFSGVFPGVVAYILMMLIMPLEAPKIHDVSPE